MFGFGSSGDYTTTDGMDYNPLISSVDNTINARLPDPSSTTNLRIPTDRQLIAKYDCEAEKNDELTFRKDDKLELIRKESAEWWVAKLGNKQGLVPANYF